MLVAGPKHVQVVRSGSIDAMRSELDVDPWVSKCTAEPARRGIAEEVRREHARMVEGAPERSLAGLPSWTAVVREGLRRMVELCLLVRPRRRKSPGKEKARPRRLGRPVRAQPIVPRPRQDLPRGRQAVGVLIEALILAGLVGLGDLIGTAEEIRRHLVVLVPDFNLQPREFVDALRLLSMVVAFFVSRPSPRSWHLRLRGLVDPESKIHRRLCDLTPGKFKLDDEPDVDGKVKALTRKRPAGAGSGEPSAPVGQPSTPPAAAGAEPPSSGQRASAKVPPASPPTAPPPTPGPQSAPHGSSAASSASTPASPTASPPSDSVSTPGAPIASSRSASDPAPSAQGSTSTDAAPTESSQDTAPSTPAAVSSAEATCASERPPRAGSPLPREPEQELPVAPRVDAAAAPPASPSPPAPPAPSLSHDAETAADSTAPITLECILEELTDKFFAYKNSPEAHAATERRPGIKANPDAVVDTPAMRKIVADTLRPVAEARLADLQRAERGRAPQGVEDGSRGAPVPPGAAGPPGTPLVAERACDPASEHKGAGPPTHEAAERGPPRSGEGS